MKSVTKSETPAPIAFGLSIEDLRVLRAPFPRENLGVKVQSISKDRTRAMLVLYLQHTDVQDRLEEVDPSWTSEVITEESRGETVYVRLRMSLRGVARENVGEGGDPKAAYSDALKRCAMLFGVGRYLYDSETVWTEYNESRDRFRSWSVDDYERALKPGRARIASIHDAPAATSASGLVAATPAQATESPPAPSAPRVQIASVTPTAPTPPSAQNPVIRPGLKTGAGSIRKALRSRDQLNRILMNLYRPYLTKFPSTQFVELLQTRYNVGETRLMTAEQLEDLVRFMEEKLQAVA